MLISTLLLGIAAVSATPLDLVKRQASIYTACPFHSSVYNALISYSASASFCSAQLSIQPETVTVTGTSTQTVRSTITATNGAVTSAGQGATVTSTSTVTQTSLTTTTKSVSGNVATATYVVTITAASGSAKLPACAVSSGVQKRQYDVDVADVVTPTQLTHFLNSQLSTGCQCLHLSTGTSTITHNVGTTVTSVLTTTIPSTTVITGSQSVIIHTTTIIVASTATVTAGQASSTTTVSSTTTIAASGAATPTAFYLKSSNGNYVSLASLTGGGFYDSLSSTSGADLFAFNSANQLTVVTSGSQYNGFIAVGALSGTDYAEDWLPLKVTKTGTDATRNALCCAMTSSKLLTCGSGEIFGDCYNHGVFEGPAPAVADDYYYIGDSCTNITLSIVAS